MLKSVPEAINFAQTEEEVLKHWSEIDAFQSSLRQSRGRPRYTFYDGPPFATGLPHYGHLLAGTIKDIVTRYAQQSGFHVERRFGWDCHGLPVEYEIDKLNGIKGPADVEKMGVAAYNEKCRGIVMRYSAEWRAMVTRMGRWIDFDNDYKTLYPWFMESVWWVFQQLYNKGLVYKGVKVMPFSTACSTPLSNFESGQNYKEVVDPAVLVSFPLESEPDVSLVAWTTTPWTLPSNLALCVNPALDYIKILDHNSGAKYIMMESRLEVLYKSADEYQVLDRFKGSALENKEYKPLFPYFAHLRKERGAFRVCCDGYVTSESGSGVVHQAPYFGEDDFRVCLAYGIITKDSKIVCPVDSTGSFTSEVTDFAGAYVKDADKAIIAHLKKDGRLVHQSTTKHSYPFCWRSETPLIYKAVPSWFIRVEHATSKLLEANSKTHWVPDFVKEKRFANWLRDARDWAVSRNRFWGTPMPLWVSEDGEEVVCVGSIAELEKLSGRKIEDLHRETVDDITIPSGRPGKPPLRRVSEVFDCWFESGSMPYAQVHYPFENRDAFESNFPADFIAEGIDQTRGWFYTLLVLSTLLFGKPPFKNLIVNGLVLASDGSKMSKRKKNYPDPKDVVNQFGADALRLYLINSPSVRGENLRFREPGVRDILKDVFLPWYNAYRFLVQNVEQYHQDHPGKEFGLSADHLHSSANVMDRWILSYANTLVDFVKTEMKAYRLYTVVPRLVKFVDVLTNWYVRMNRRRMKGETAEEDRLHALETTCSVLLTMVRLMAPFTPFLTEHIYSNLKVLLPEGDREESVHYLLLPDAQSFLIDTNVERRVSRMQSVIELGRVIRDRRTLPLKYPVKEVIVITKDSEYLSDVRSLENYVLEELNCRSLKTTADKESYGVKLRAEPDHKRLGARLKGDFKDVTSDIKSLNDEELNAFLAEGQLSLRGHVLGSDDLRVMYEMDDETMRKDFEPNSDNEILVLLDVRPDQSMADEGLAREITNRIQRLRKKAKLVPTDAIVVQVDVTKDPDGQLTRIREEYTAFVEAGIKQPLKYHAEPIDGEVVIEENAEVKNAEIKITVKRTHGAAGDEPQILKRSSQPLAAAIPTAGPACRYVTIACTKSGETAVVLLENPAGQNLINYWNLLRHARAALNCWSTSDVKLVRGSGQPVRHTDDILGLAGSVLHLVCDGTKPKKLHPSVPKFLNVSRNGSLATVLLRQGISRNQLYDLVSSLFSADVTQLRDANKNELSVDPVSMDGQTLFC